MLDRKHLAAGIFGLALIAAPALAAEYVSDNEQIEVTAPRHHPTPSIPGAPIRDVTLTREVRFDDLDLHTHHGVRMLRSRIMSTALLLCKQIDVMYPVTLSDNPPCYESAVHNAMLQAHEVIRQARGYAENE